MYNQEPNCSPPVDTRPSAKTIKLNNRKNQNGWSPLKLKNNLSNNSEGILLF